MIKQLIAQTKAEMTMSLRSPAAMVPIMILPVTFWLFLGIPSAKQNAGLMGAYMLLSFATYSMLQAVLFSVAIAIAQERASGWYRYLRTTPVSMGASMAAKVTASALVGLVAVLLLLLVGNLTAKLNVSVATWLGVLVRLLLAVLPFAALSTWFGYLAKSVSATVPLVNMVFLPMSFMSGFFMPIDSLPNFVQGIAKVLPGYHAIGLVHAAVVPTSSGQQLTHLLVLLGFTVLFGVLTVMAYRKDQGANYR